MQNKKDWQLPAGQLLFCVNCKEIVYFLLANPSSSGKIILYALYYLPKERCKVQRKKKMENGILRLIFVAVALLIQVAWILAFMLIYHYLTIKRKLYQSFFEILEEL